MRQIRSYQSGEWVFLISTISVRNFIIDDDLHMGPGVIFATKTVAGSKKSIGTCQVTAVAIREKETDHFSKVLRFTYAVPGELQQVLNTWIAVLKSICSTSKTLFSGVSNGDEIVQMSQRIAEDRIGNV